MSIPDTLQPLDSFTADLGVATTVTEAANAVMAAQPAVTGFEGFAEEALASFPSEESVGMASVKDSSNFDVFFRKPDGKRKKIKGSTDALQFLKTVSVSQVIGVPDQDVEAAPKKRGPKPKKAEGSTAQAPNSLNMWFYDDHGHAVVDFITALADPELEFEVDLHVLDGNSNATLEVFTFEGCKVSPRVRSLTFDRSDDEAEALVVPLGLTFTQMTRSVE